MLRTLRGRFAKSDWIYLIFSLALIVPYMYYTISFLYYAPYSGIVFTTTSKGWQVNDSKSPALQLDDTVTQIGDLTFEEYLSNRLLVPFSGYQEGDTVQLVVNEGERVVDITMPKPTIDELFIRLVSTLWFFPFWAAGTIVLLFLQPRDRQWRLLVLFMYITSIWVLAGAVSSLRIGGSRILLGVTAWLMMPVFINLHFEVPNPILPRLSRILLPLVYTAAIVLSILEILQKPAAYAPQIGLLVAILVSILLIGYRIFRRDFPTSVKIAARLMLVGAAIAFGPGVLVVMLPGVIGTSEATTLRLFIALIAMPLLPFFYIYAIYKRHLGALEFRFSRLLTIYSFILIYPTLFIVVLLFAEQWIETARARTAYLLFASITFVLASGPLLSWYRRFVGRLAYGTEHDPDDLLRIFAKRIPGAIKRSALVDLLRNEITPVLLIRQSALYLFDGDKIELLYSDGITSEQLESSTDVIRQYAEHSGVYIPPPPSSQDNSAWVRLPIALVTRSKEIGIWLLGRRDPDDFYPHEDVELLEALANQIAPVIENILLYEALELQADNLADQVAARTTELRSERDRTQAILDSAGDGIFFADPLGKIQYVNSAMISLTGYSEGELIGKTLELYVRRVQDQKFFDEMWNAIRDGKPWGGELAIKAKSGTLIDINLTIAPIRSSSGQLTGFVGVQSDISKLKEVDRLKTSIISSVSHELKTPLTTIKTYIMLLQRGKPEKRDVYFEILHREANRLAIIIEDLLNLSALDTGKIATDLAPAVVAELIDEAFEDSGPLAASKGIELTKNDGSQELKVLADSNQIRQVLSNLIINALNYTPENGRVELAYGPGKANGSDHVWLSVSDNGPGIEPEEIPHLFERFYRGRAAREGNSPGTGLGLSICKEIVTRHNGRIEIKSKPGLGSTFIVWLPTPPRIPETPEQSGSTTSESQVPDQA